MQAMLTQPPTFAPTIQDPLHPPQHPPSPLIQLRAACSQPRSARSHPSPRFPAAPGRVTAARVNTPAPPPAPCPSRPPHLAAHLLVGSRWAPAAPRLQGRRWQCGSGTAAGERSGEQRGQAPLGFSRTAVPRLCGRDGLQTRPAGTLGPWASAGHDPAAGPVPVPGVPWSAIPRSPPYPGPCRTPIPIPLWVRSPSRWRAGELQYPGVSPCLHNELNEPVGEIAWWLVLGANLLVWGTDTGAPRGA